MISKISSYLSENRILIDMEASVVIWCAEARLKVRKAPTGER